MSCSAECLFACCRGRQFVFLIACREQAVFADASILRAGYVIRDIYRKAASDLQRRDKGLAGVAEGLQRRREVGPLRKLFDFMDGVKGIQIRPPSSSTSRHCKCQALSMNVERSELEQFYGWEQ